VSSNGGVSKFDIVGSGVLFSRKYHKDSKLASGEGYEIYISSCHKAQSLNTGAGPGVIMIM